MKLTKIKKLFGLPFAILEKLESIDERLKKIEESSENVSRATRACDGVGISRYFNSDRYRH